MAETTRWIVTLEPGGSLAAIRSRLEGAGLNIEQVLEEIGVVVGSGDDHAASAVRKLDGVADVSPEREIDIGPPGSPGTW
jgi:hypothetical protein